MKVNTLKLMAIVVAVLAVLLFIAGFLVPPLGVIDGSVLKAAGELLGFNSLFLAWNAIDKGYGAEVRHGDTVAKIDADDDDEKS